ncbi:MAG TPA: hypothetical protein VJC16_00990 [Candidatus Nanoarchaeia archaeon]|nr:hypothetical protein [Candidatus Nanoarchaeia archaeon]
MKGQSMPLNVVIVAAILIIVLFVVVLIFTGKIKGFSQDLESCVAKGGNCENVQSCGEKGEGWTTIPRTECEESSPPQKCCIKIL